MKIKDNNLPFIFLNLEDFHVLVNRLKNNTDEFKSIATEFNLTLKRNNNLCCALKIIFNEFISQAIKFVML